MTQTLQPTWDLDVIFPNGSASSEYAAFLDALEQDIRTLAVQTAERVAKASPLSLADWVELFSGVQDLLKRFTQGAAFASCLVAQNVHDQKAKLLQSRVQQILAGYLSLQTEVNKLILTLPDAEWQELLAHAELQPIAFALQEQRQKALDRLPAEQEALINDLAVDGYHAWNSLYNVVIGRMSIPFAKNGEVKQLSVGQAWNLTSDPDGAVREQVFAQYEAAFAKEAELFAGFLNRLAGFRLQTYKHRGWDSVLHEPTRQNRMQPETLQVMWEVIEQNKKPFLAYMERKAQLLGKKKLGWQDRFAPIGPATERKLTFAEGAERIIEQFGKVSPQMADFAAKAFAERWIEAEDRPGKRPGGFCTTFPISGQSRIFMTYSGSPSTVSTLAHELGHAYHSYVMRDMPQFAREYEKNVAETASTFAELIMDDAAVKQAADETERLVLLEQKLQGCNSMFFDIHARFLFETRFYEERKKGLLSVEQLNELMLKAQKDAYHDALESYHPHFWASKLHFYSTHDPFYNFPYTFGYLFSSGVYAQALREGPAFEEKYVALLRDTASMETEELAMRHLGVDLTKPAFWQSTIDVFVADAEEFLRLTAK